MTMWQFFAALNGYAEAHSPKDGKLTASEREELEADILAYGQGRPSTLSTQTYWWDERGPEPAGVVTFTVN